MTTTEATQIKIVCRICKDAKPLDDFSRSDTGKYGRKTRCKKCSSENWKARYSKENRSEFMGYF